MFARGAFAHINPRDVVLRMMHNDPPAGIGIALEERDDAAYMAFRVSHTSTGDDLLTLARDGVTRGVSVGFADEPGGTKFVNVNGKRTRMYTRAGLREVSTTWKPAYASAQVLAVREEEEAPMAEGAAEQTTPVDLSAITSQITTALESRDAKSAELQEKVLDRLEKIEERERASIVV